MNTYRVAYTGGTTPTGRTWENADGRRHVRDIKAPTREEAERIANEEFGIVVDYIYQH